MITLEEVKAYLGITGTDDDAYLTAQIAAVESMVQTYCGREFDYVEDQEQVIFKPLIGLFLTRFPLQSVQTITDELGNTYPATDFLLNKQSGIVFYNANGCRWGSAQQLTVVYTGGYVECPADLKAALLDMVATRYYQRGEDVSRPVRSEKVDGIGSKTFAVDSDFYTGANGFGNFALNNYAGILDLYRIETVIA